ncbi:MAG: hypothetical protein ABIH11_04170 [Candidatus Altiarchaeota archaeon]
MTKIRNKNKSHEAEGDDDIKTRFRIIVGRINAGERIKKIKIGGRIKGINVRGIKKQYIAYILVILLCLLAVSYIIYKESEKVKPAPKPVQIKVQREDIQDECKGLIGVEWGNCMINSAVRQNSPSICSQLPVEKDKLECIIRVVEETGRLGLCNQMEDTVKTECITRAAVKMGRQGQCVRLEGVHADDCRISVAVTTGKIGLCKLIMEPKKTECMKKVALANDNVGQCNQLTGRDNIDCVMDIAVKNERAGLCLKYDYPEKSECITRIAIKSDQLGLCTNLDGDEVDKCRTLFMTNAASK